MFNIHVLKDGFTSVREADENKVMGEIKIENDVEKACQTMLSCPKNLSVSLQFLLQNFLEQLNISVGLFFSDST